MIAGDSIDPLPAADDGERPLAPDWRRQILLGTIIAAICVMAAAVARPMVTYRAITLGAAPFEIGLVQSAYSLLPMLTAITMGSWVDRFGEARVIALGCLTLVGGAVVLAVAPSLPVLGIGQISMGFGVIAAAIATQSLIANHGPAHRQVHRFGWFSVAVSLGQIAGPILAAALVAPAGANASADAVSGEAGMLVFLVAAATAGSGLVLVRMLPSWHRPGHGTLDADGPGTWRAAATILRSPGIAPAMFVSLMVASALDVLIVYLPAHGEETGISVVAVGGLLAVRAAATLVSRAFMGSLTDVLGLGRTLLLSTALAAGAFALLPVISALPVLFGLMVFIGLGLGIGQPLTVAWIGIQTRPTQRGLAFGVRHTGNLAMLTLVPVSMGLVAGAAGIASVWVVVAVFLGGATVVAARTRFAPITRKG